MHHGPIRLEIDHPIIRQTMRTTDTGKVKDTINQHMGCADTGSDLVRITVQGKHETVTARKIRLTYIFTPMLQLLTDL